MIESSKLMSGIFWVLCDDELISNWKLLIFAFPVTRNGNHLSDKKLNSKNGITYNHQLTWGSYVKNNKTYYPYHKKDFNYYPRGRVQIANDKAIIYLNPLIHKSDIISDIKKQFSLTKMNISNVTVKEDNSYHYQCFTDFKN